MADLTSEDGGEKSDSWKEPRLTGRWRAVAVAIVLAILGGVAALIAFDAGTWALVIVTGALAITTGGMAYFTRTSVVAAERTATAAEQDMRQSADLVGIGQAQVREAQRQADAARAALDAERQPLIVPTTPEETTYRNTLFSHHAFGLTSDEISDFPVAKRWIDQRTNTAWFVLKLRNVGRGTALLDVVFVLPGPGEDHAAERGQPYSMVVAPQDRVKVAFAYQPNPGFPGRLFHWVRSADDSLSVRIRYRYIGRQRWFTTTITYGRDRPDPEVEGVEYDED